jgi:hypothetical protein
MEKDSRMFWRGSTCVGPILYDRVKLLEVMKGHEDVTNVAEISWERGEKPSNFVSPDKMCLWKYIIYTEGTFLR